MKPNHAIFHHMIHDNIRLHHIISYHTVSYLYITTCIIDYVSYYCMILLTRTCMGGTAMQHTVGGNNSA